MRTAAFGLVLLVGLANPTWAGEGVIEINQAAALQGGVTPGDTPGFPVVLTRSGAYRLTGNLDVPIAQGGIVVANELVTLDLGGFTISSTNACGGYPVTNCTVNDSGVPGIFAGEARVVVRNGSVRGMGGDCVFLDGDSSEIDGVYARNCGRSGLAISATSGRVTNSSAVLNRFQGISIANGGSVESSEARGNGGHGIFVEGLTSLVARIVENRLHDNGGRGIASASTFQPVASRNFLASNLGGTFFLVVSLGDNLCQNAFC
jgi:hypothetical protein